MLAPPKIIGGFWRTFFAWISIFKRARTKRQSSLLRFAQICMKTRIQRTQSADLCNSNLRLSTVPPRETRLANFRPEQYPLYSPNQKPQVAALVFNPLCILSKVSASNGCRSYHSGTTSGGLWSETRLKAVPTAETRRSFFRRPFGACAVCLYKPNFNAHPNMAGFRNIKSAGVFSLSLLQASAY